MTQTNSDWHLNWFNSPFYHQLYKKRDYNEATFFMSNLLKRLKVQENSSILDLACGTGLFGEQLLKIYNKSQIYGSDISVNSLLLAKKKKIYKNLEQALKVVNGQSQTLSKKISLHVTSCREQFGTIPFITADCTLFVKQFTKVSFSPKL